MQTLRTSKQKKQKRKGVGQIWIAEGGAHELRYLLEVHQNVWRLTMKLYASLRSAADNHRRLETKSDWLKLGAVDD